MSIPKQATDAAFPASIHVGGLTLRPFTLQHVFFLRRIEHPILAGAEAKLSIEDKLLLVTALAMDPAEIATLLADGLDRKALLERAYLAAGALPADAIGEATAAALQQIDLAFSTAVPTRDPEAGEESPLPRRSTTGAGPSSSRKG